MSVCLAPHCPNERAGSGRYCREHAPAARPRRGAEVDPRYQTVRWQRRRIRVLSESPVCPCGHEASTVCDHIVAVEDGGDFWAEDNHQALGVRCHSIKTNAEVRRRRFVLRRDTRDRGESTWNHTP